MTPKEINQSIESKKINLTKGEKIEYWVDFFFVLIPLSFFGFFTIYEPITNGEFPILGIITIIAFLLFLRHKLTSTNI